MPAQHRTGSTITRSEEVGRVINQGPPPSTTVPTARTKPEGRRQEDKNSTRRPKTTGNGIDGQEEFRESGLSAFGIAGLEQ
jgi:hypothetical protein